MDEHNKKQNKKPKKQRPCIYDEVQMVLIKMIPLIHLNHFSQADLTATFFFTAFKFCITQGTDQLKLKLYHPLFLVP